MPAKAPCSSPRRSPSLQDGLWLARPQAHWHGVAGAWHQAILASASSLHLSCVNYVAPEVSWVLTPDSRSTLCFLNQDSE